MKPYHYIVIGLLIIVAVILFFARGTTNEQQAILDCVNSGGQFNVSSQTCVPASGNMPTTPTTPSTPSSPTTSTAPKATATVAPRITAPTGYYSGPKPTMLPDYSNISDPNTVIIVSNPGANTTVYSPITVTGQAKGWFFEGVFPVYLVDAKGHILAQGLAKAQSDWTSPDFVAFTTTLSFARQPSGSIGYIILRKDNPSGLPQNDAAVERQVTFQ